MPVIGATSQNSERCSTSAPNVWRMREALPVCRAKPNWMPRKPKLILKICAVLSRCFVRLVWVFIGVSWIGCNTIKKMQGMHNLLFPIVPLVCAVVFEKVMRYLQLKELTVQLAVGGDQQIVAPAIKPEWSECVAIGAEKLDQVTLVGQRLVRSKRFFDEERQVIQHGDGRQAREAGKDTGVLGAQPHSAVAAHREAGNEKRRRIGYMCGKELPDGTRHVLCHPAFEILCGVRHVARSIAP